MRVFDYSNYRTYLRDYLETKKKERRSFSYGVWARQLNLKSPSTLIMILNGQRNPGPQLISDLITHFGFQSEEEKYFRDLVRLDKVKNDVQHSLEMLKGLQERNPRKGFRVVSHEAFRSISSWYFYAIRAMLDLKDFSEDENWIAAKLRFGVTAPVARQALETLVNLGLVRRDLKGKLVNSFDHIDTPTDLRDEAIKKYHEQSLDNAKASLRELAPAEREISCVTFAMDQESLEKAKQLIRKFQVEMCEILEKKSADAVYHLEVAFFPVTETAHSTETLLSAQSQSLEAKDAVH